MKTHILRDFIKLDGRQIESKKLKGLDIVAYGWDDINYWVHDIKCNSVSDFTYIVNETCQDDVDHDA